MYEEFLSQLRRTILQDNRHTDPYESLIYHRQNNKMQQFTQKRKLPIKIMEGLYSHQCENFQKIQINFQVLQQFFLNTCILSVYTFS
jgi:hypothetical protein